MTTAGHASTKHSVRHVTLKTLAVFRSRGLVVNYTGSTGK